MFALTMKIYHVSCQFSAGKKKAHRYNACKGNKHSLNIAGTASMEGNTY
jgi:hypothetical protein